ncbi:hypothetical protein DY000_02052864 [Brassica cretica]|uniref:Uncharacterized protein n=1 Tax=Brassica cretica TaxID=69181 RepID=A0ABQ7AM11_BRACR|nr:hypothetical protein DY000_02052864 [Brassica cretica]
MFCFQNIRLINLRHLLTMVEPLIRLIVHSRSLLALRTLRFILGNLEVHSNLCSDKGGSVDILYKNPEVMRIPFSCQEVNPYLAVSNLEAVLT